MFCNTLNDFLVASYFAIKVATNSVPEFHHQLQCKHFLCINHTLELQYQSCEESLHDDFLRITLGFSRPKNRAASFWSTATHCYLRRFIFLKASLTKTSLSSFCTLNLKIKRFLKTHPFCLILYSKNRSCGLFSNLPPQSD